jgi:hypothetical protein
MSMWFQAGLGSDLSEEERRTLLRDVLEKGRARLVRDLVEGRVLELRAERGQCLERWLEPSEAAPVLAACADLGSSISYDHAIDLDEMTTLVVSGHRGEPVELEAWPERSLGGPTAARQQLEECIEHAAAHLDDPDEHGEDCDCEGRLESLREVLACLKACMKYRVVMLFRD